ncbi:hypothetical protein SAY86_018778 [Trapa natans]|uniref:Mitochondrial import inner membrane translocase subunit Tim16 n=1 Tax=Trapa natans TaxID=22666 RepID=A0AAN7LFM1_TRANT|nr:hypothetical protein SAY86_018778 [Trapa natans]
MGVGRNTWEKREHGKLSPLYKPPGRRQPVPTSPFITPSNATDLIEFGLKYLLLFSSIGLIEKLCHRREKSFLGIGASVKSLVMAARILANLIVMGGGILARAFVQAYRQALANASKNGTAQEAMQNTIRRASKAMTEQEARQILGIQEGAAWEEILKKYDVLFERNAKNGSFYLQSKVHRAKECLEVVYRGKGESARS